MRGACRGLTADTRRAECEARPGAGGAAASDGRSLCIGLKAPRDHGENAGIGCFAAFGKVGHDQEFSTILPDEPLATKSSISDVRRVGGRSSHKSELVCVPTLYYPKNRIVLSYFVILFLLHFYYAYDKL